LQAAHQSIGDAVKANDTAAIDQAATTIGNLTAQSTAIDAKANAAFYRILTPDQQAKFATSPGPGRGPGPGPDGFRRPRQ
jgi:Spy/CpxP family protein refolding chaperone